MEITSLSLSLLQFGQYEDNFVGEDLELQFKTNDAAGRPESDENSRNQRPKGKRRINRRDAARAVAVALTNPELQGKKVEVWTDEMR
jgi:hypothetical protein